MKRAAGVLFITRGGDALLMRRTGRPDKDADCVGCWSFPGGGIDGDETPEDAARREVLEETGQGDIGPLKLWTRRVRDEVDFTTFISVVDEPFAPILNDEHDAAGWIPRSFAQKNPDLHPGAYVALNRFDMDELAVAKAMAAGELASPQLYNKDLMLIALRITGTGVSYRSAHKEYVWRDPALYMNQEFLERCNGLEVIFRHPKKTMLNTQEFLDRIVGTIFVPYLKSELNEVWGIAKIRDMDAGQMLATEEMSTSPGVLCIGEKIEVSDGRRMLLEDKPTLLDHLAILPPGEPGVWDKGLPVSGVDAIDAVPLPDDDEPLDVILRRLQINEVASRLR